MSKEAEEALNRLEAVAKTLSVRVIYSRNLQRGGHCWLHGKPLLLVASHLDAKEKAELLEHGLAHLRPRLTLPDATDRSVDSTRGEC